MAEPNNQQTKELPMEFRLLIALVLMLGVLIGTPYVYKKLNILPAEAPVADKPKPDAAPPKPAEPKPAEAKPAAATPAAAAQAAPPAPETVAATAEETVTIETDVYRIQFSNRGAVVRNWLLKKYKDGHLKSQLDLVSKAGAAKVGWPMSVQSKNGGAAKTVNDALFTVTRSADGLGVEFRFSSGRVNARKSFSFTRNSYLSQVTSEITEGGAPVVHELSWRGGFGDMAVYAPETTQRTLYFDSSASKLVRNDVKAASDGPKTEAGAFQFAGIEDLYFTAVFLPRGSSGLTITTFGDKVKQEGASEEHDFAGAAVGGESRNELALFAGPKDLDILKKVDPKLEQVVDFGWFGFIAKPLFFVIQWLNVSYVHNYGWAIVIATIFINMALLPLKITSFKSMKKMQVLQPQIQAINDRYKGVGMRDPKRQNQNEEVMALYKKHNVNPLSSGCLPLLLQMPLLYAFYQVFTVAIEMRGASWLWVQDLSQPEQMAIRILPVAMIASQFFMQKMTPPSPGMDPTQQKIMLFMPLMFGVMFYGASSGLMLYWMTGNLIAIAQQWFFNKTSASDAGVAVVPAKKSGKK